MAHDPTPSAGSETFDLAEPGQVDVTPEIDEISELLSHERDDDNGPDAAWRQGYPYETKISRKDYEKQKRKLQIELLKLQAWVKESGERRRMHEVGLYTVKNGKVVEERFFY